MISSLERDVYIVSVREKREREKGLLMWERSMAIQEQWEKNREIKTVEFGAAERNKGEGWWGMCLAKGKWVDDSPIQLFSKFTYHHLVDTAFCTLYDSGPHSPMMLEF